MATSFEAELRGLSQALERERGRRESLERDVAGIRLELIELKTTVRIWAAISGAGAGIISIAGSAAARSLIGG